MGVAAVVDASFSGVEGLGVGVGTAVGFTIFVALLETLVQDVPVASPLEVALQSVVVVLLSPLRAVRPAAKQLSLDIF